MRFSSPFQVRGCSPGKMCGKNQFNKKIKSEKTYIHYNNGVYMGGLVSYKRNGQGIILLDEGTSGVITSNFDSLSGHSVFFGENEIASVLYIRNGNYEIVVRRGCCILKVPFYGCDDTANGNGVLLDYGEMKMYHLVYQTGKLFRKVVETNRNVLRKMEDCSLKGILDARHVRGLKMDLELENGMKMVKKGNKMVIGYFDGYGNLDGVCFKLTIDPERYDLFEESLEVKCH